MEKIGKQTIKFNTPPTILDCSSIVGPKESDGPLAKYFDKTLDDEFWGEKTWEKAESKIIKETVNTVISKSGISTNEIDCIFAGDLLNQCISSCFGLREENIPFFCLCGRSDKRCVMPKGVRYSDKMYNWTWDNLKALFAGK